MRGFTLSQFWTLVRNCLVICLMFIPLLTYGDGDEKNQHIYTECMKRSGSTRESCIKEYKDIREVDQKYELNSCKDAKDEFKKLQKELTDASSKAGFGAITSRGNNCHQAADSCDQFIQRLNQIEKDDEAFDKEGHFEDMRVECPRFADSKVKPTEAKLDNLRTNEGRLRDRLNKLESEERDQAEKSKERLERMSQAIEAAQQDIDKLEEDMKKYLNEIPERLRKEFINRETAMDGIVNEENKLRDNFSRVSLVIQNDIKAQLDK